MKQAARLFHCSERIIYQQIKNGMIKAIQLSERKTLIKRKHLDKAFKQVDFQPIQRTERSKNPALVYCVSMADAQQHFGISEKAIMTRSNGMILKYYVAESSVMYSDQH